MRDWLRLIIGSLQPDSPAEFFADLPVLRTERLVLRPVTMHDAKDIFAYAHDPDVARFVLWDAHRTLKDSKRYVRYLRSQYRWGIPSSYGIEHTASGHLIGTIGFMNWSEEHQTAEIGYSLGRNWWNQGFMTEAVRAVLYLSFEMMALHRIEAMHDTENLASGCVMAKCGMRHEGTLTGRVWNKGEWRDVQLWAITRDEWQLSAAGRDNVPYVS